MKNLKKLFFILFPAGFILLEAWGLSGVGNINWMALGFFSFIITLVQVLLCIRSPEKLADPVMGWIVSGTCYVYCCSSLIVGEYACVFEFLEMILFAFTFFFVFMPAYLKK